jgi:hypothetical protein
MVLAKVGGMGMLSGGNINWNFSCAFWCKKKNYLNYNTQLTSTPVLGIYSTDRLAHTQAESCTITALF